MLPKHLDEKVAALHLEKIGVELTEFSKNNRIIGLKQGHLNQLQILNTSSKEKVLFFVKKRKLFTIFISHTIGYFSIPLLLYKHFTR